MTSKVAESIRRGLEEALAYAEGSAVESRMRAGVPLRAALAKRSAAGTHVRLRRQTRLTRNSIPKWRPVGDSNPC